jgi:hypothetical protein
VNLDGELLSLSAADDDRRSTEKGAAWNFDGQAGD